jgi:multiple sugar transport system substrate-binding protein
MAMSSDRLRATSSRRSAIHDLTLAVACAALIVPSLSARAADLVVWWQKGFYAQEDAALKEIIAAFEQETGKQVEVSFHVESELPAKIAAALEAEQPPDLAFGFTLDVYISEWAFDGRLVDLSATVGLFSDLFDPDALAWWMLLNQETGQKALYALPMGRTTNHVHLWKRLLEQAGFTLEDIPKAWDAFWSFWCDQVQPAVRRATGRDDLWGVGLNMSGQAVETQFQLFQFLAAYDADYVTRDGKLVIDDPQVRQRLVKAIDSYTGIYRNGCTPPDSTTWDGYGNNERFLNGTAVMTPNNTLSVVNALKHERPQDYYEDTATIEWPLGPDGEIFPIGGTFFAAPVFREGGHVDTAKEFVRFLVAEGWLAHYLDFAGERMLPPMPKLRDAPFWLDPSDPHRMAAVMQIASRPMQYDYLTVTGDWRHNRVFTELVWGKAIHRVVTEGMSPSRRSTRRSHASNRS